MTDITSARNLIQLEETRTRAPNSEAMFTRVGASLNFIAKQQVIPYQFEFANDFRPLGVGGGEGGVLTTINDQEIVGVSGRLRNRGSSGTTTIDLHYERSGVDQGSIWAAQKLIIDTTAGIGWFFVNLIPTVPVTGAASGITLPTFGTTTFDAGDALRLDLDTNAGGAQDLIINAWIRPR